MKHLDQNYYIDPKEILRQFEMIGEPTRECQQSLKAAENMMIQIDRGFFLAPPAGEVTLLCLFD